MKNTHYFFVAISCVITFTWIALVINDIYYVATFNRENAIQPDDYALDWSLFVMAGIAIIHALSIIMKKSVIMTTTVSTIANGFLLICLIKGISASIIDEPRMFIPLIFTTVFTIFPIVVLFVYNKKHIKG